MPNLDEMIEQINAQSEGGAYFVCIHLEPHMIVGPFPAQVKHIAEEFLQHLLTKWPALEAHVIYGNGIGRQA